MGLYIESLKEGFPDYIVNIMWPQNAPQKRLLQGIFVPSDATAISVSTQSEIDRDLLTGGVTDLVKGFATQGIKNATKDNALIGSAIDQYAVSLRQTIKGWVNGSSAYSFNVDFVVFPTGMDGVGTCSSYKSLLETVNSLTTTSSNLNDVIQNPEWLNREDWWKAANSSIADESILNGYSFCVSIGSWFNCSRLLPESANVTFAKYLNSDGVPQYAKVSLGFRTYRNLNFKELSEIITK